MSKIVRAPVLPKNAELSKTEILAVVLVMDHHVTSLPARVQRVVGKCWTGKLIGAKQMDNGDKPR